MLEGDILYKVSDTNWTNFQLFVFIVSNVLDFCTIEQPCAENEGDCDNNNECQSGLRCGEDNCPALLGYDWSIDCCYKPIRT